MAGIEQLKDTRDQEVYTALVEAVSGLPYARIEGGKAIISISPASLVARRKGWQESTARSRLVPLSKAGLIMYYAPKGGEERFWTVVMPSDLVQDKSAGTGKPGEEADEILLRGLDELTQKLPELVATRRDETYSIVKQLRSERDAANAALQEVLAEREAAEARVAAAEAERDELKARNDLLERKFESARTALSD
jgi:pyruvate-formate lyase